jgi:pimeloyl-ACP methyl ester carboxylesterase
VRKKPFLTKSGNRGGNAMSSSRTISANGIEMFVREQGQGPLVVLCHGWPELSYSWRHQLPALAEAGFHVVAPDMRGFGRTSAPADIGAYTIFDTVGDMVALVAALGEKQAVIVGHDWGAPVAWHAAMFRPDIFTKVAGLSVPPPFRGRARPLESLRESGVTNFYWQYFQMPGVAEAEFERDVALTMRKVLGRGISDPATMFVEQGKGFLHPLRSDQPLPNWLTEADIAYFAEIYKECGFRGGLNWYRNLDRNWELTAPWHGAQIHQPSLFIAGSRDSVITGLIGAKRIADMERVLPNLTRKLIIEGAAHWIQQERPEEVNAALIAFLE